MIKKVAVIDTGYGDAGKGSFVAYLCSVMADPIVVRFSGGHQAGHTVVREDGERHVFSSFGSGTLQGAPTFWTDNPTNCTFYPTAFLNELEMLKDKEISPKIYIRGEIPVTTIYDVIANRGCEKTVKDGSCGVGFGKTLEREEKYYSLLVEDLKFPSVMEQKIKQIQSYYGMTHISYDDFYNDCLNIVDHIEIVHTNDILLRHRSLIYEGSQGLMLDKNIGYFPHVTRANVGCKAIHDDLTEVFYITRAYQTRHGNGPMSNEEEYGHNIKKNPNETNVSNFQGEFRRSLLDLDVLKYSIYKDWLNCSAWRRSLVITCLDHVQDDFRFTYDGHVHCCLDEKEFVSRISSILDFTEVYISKDERYNRIERVQNV